MPSPIFRRATREDLPAIIAMLADDALGATRENPRLPLDPAYLAAFAALEHDPNHLPLVAELEGRIVGYLQLSFIPGLGHRGMWRGQIENVRVAADARGSGLGGAMLEWAIDRCRAKGCGAIQLTTDNSRHDAHRFYERLGFVASHVGMKLKLV